MIFIAMPLLTFCNSLQLVSSKISLQNCLSLAGLLKDGEELSDLMALSQEEILLHWFNYQLKEAVHQRRVCNLSKHIMVRAREGGPSTVLYVCAVWAPPCLAVYMYLM